MIWFGYKNISLLPAYDKTDPDSITRINPALCFKKDHLVQFTDFEDLFYI